MKYTIVGAGIGGLSTAVALEQKGIEYQLVEKVPEFKEVGAGILLAPNALQVYEKLGLLDAVKSEGNFVDRITIGKSDFSPLSDLFQNDIKKIYGYSTIAIHRARLQKLLVNRIPKDKLLLGKDFKSYSNRKDEKVCVKFEDNTELISDYLIGADGINSKIRKQLFPNAKIRYTGQTCWRGIANFDFDDDLKNRCVELWGEEIRFGFSKISEGKVYWFAVAKRKSNQQDYIEEVKDKLSKMYANFDPIISQLIASTPFNQIFRNDINDLEPMATWYDNKTCLIGDAGHATTPNMGQGGGQAIEDAYCLSNILEKHSGNQAFGSFQQQRKQKVDNIVSQSWMTGKIAHWKYGTGVRNFLLKNMPKNMMLKKMIAMYRID
ncbi:MAG: FAD-dependent monooxygenase [Chitinophagales bacterium]